MKIPDLGKGLTQIDTVIMKAYENKWFWLIGAGSLVLLFLAFIGFLMRILS